MKKYLWIILLLGSGFLYGQGEWQKITADLDIRRLSDQIWQHRSFQVVGDIRFPSNGLLVIGEETLFMIDTAWGEAATDALLAWAKETFGKPVKQAVVSHFHPDRMGGIKNLHQIKTVVFAGEKTAELARVNSLPLPDTLFESSQQFDIDGTKFEAYFPGPGHSPDNIVVWFPDEKLLFGGCLIKSLEAPNLGYTGDAVIEQWAATMENLKSRYGETLRIVPGHGKIGDVALINHTIALVTAYLEKAENK